MSSIDRLDWHSGNDFPKDLPEINGGTHIGMYLNWIIDTDLIGELHIKESIDGIEKVKAKTITGRDFLIDYCDGKFWDEELNEIGQAFTKDYYSSDKYFDDYANILGSDVESIYHVENNTQNYELIKQTLDNRFEKWKNGRNKKPWQFWK